MMSMFLKIISFFLVLVLVITSNTEEECSTHQNCSECLNSSECIWTIKPNEKCVNASLKSSCAFNNETKKDCSFEEVKTCPEPVNVNAESGNVTENTTAVTSITSLSTESHLTTNSTDITNGSTEASSLSSSTGSTQSEASTEPTPSTEKSTKPSAGTTEMFTTKSSTTSTDQSDTGGRQFDAPSFIGGIVLCLGLLAIAYVGYKFYRARTEHNYHTLHETVHM